MTGHTRQLLRKNPLAPAGTTLDRSRLGEDDAFSWIRCPLCACRPGPSDLWTCHGVGTPEPYAGCGVSWNTFSTGGRCPGCAHQWQWTSCLRCGQWSRHLDWYEVPQRG